MIKLDSLIFDLDGTLWDATPAYSESWNDVLKKHGFTDRITPKDLLPAMGLERELALEILLPTIPKTKRNEIYDEIIPAISSLKNMDKVTLFLNVDTELPILAKQFSLFIVSNCPSGLIELFVRKFGFENLIKDFICHGDNPVPKSQNIRLIASKHQLKNPIYIGDTWSDRLAAQQAGVLFGFASYGFGSCENFDYEFEDFKKISERLIK